MAKLLHIVAYQPEIALNLGNMIRTSACMDLPLHVIEPCGFPFSIKSVQRSAMDYANLAELYHHMDWVNFTEALPNRRVLLTTKTDQSYTKFEFRKGDALILGQESAGVPQSVRDDCHEAVTIPLMKGRSLNVGVAMAMVAGEAIRQLTL